ncbi:Hypothetical Protein FCC1311_027772 [Hondaea fermentalgiana]|uniref:Uncharacterized protein n=1 Tax=Hondaea fermentalgiana TaxID=2315210 RepID=A0A2R5G688_9STRA|nr:Hypothetical Protein FCC1311_027772 [Hondaea fermentalgiana]|eukprot:GBG26556.1 Hypothetical Protein FCC1311_027772 [Hondaea fermentalgiana]
MDETNASSKVGVTESSKIMDLQDRHDRKTRALMKNIDQLRKQVDALKAQSKESRRTALIQTLRNEKKEQELVVDVLKRELGTRTGQSQQEIDDIVIRATLGGPKRFRPMSREEMNREIRLLKHELGKNARKDARAGMRQDPMDATDSGQGPDISDGDLRHDDAESRAHESKLHHERENAPRKANESGDPSSPSSPSADVSDRAGNNGRARVGELLARIEDLQVELVARERSSKAYVDTIDGLRREVRDLHMVRDKLERMGEKHGRLKQTIRDLQSENAELAHDKENLEEEIRQLESEHATLRGELQHHSHLEQSSTSARTESLELLETVKDLKAREMSMMDEMDSLRMQLAEAKQRIFSNTRSVQENERLAQEHQALAENLSAERQRADIAERRVEKAEALRSGLEAKLATLEEELQDAKEAAASAAAITQQQKIDSFGNPGGDEALAGDLERDEGEDDDDGEGKRSESLREKDLVSRLEAAEEARDEALRRCKTAEAALGKCEATEGALEMLARVEISRASERARELELELDDSKHQLHALRRDKKRLHELLQKHKAEHRARIIGILEQRNIRSVAEAELLRRDTFLNERLVRLDAEVQRRQASSRALQIALERVLAHARILHARFEALGITDCPPLPDISRMGAGAKDGTNDDHGNSHAGNYDDDGSDDGEDDDDDLEELSDILAAAHSEADEDDL